MYKPLPQSLVNDFSSVVQYHEFAPSPVLSKYVSNYFIYKSILEPNKEFNFRCVPDGCIAVTINCLKYEKLQLLGTQSAMLINGTSSFDEPVEMFGIQFLPGSFHIFFPYVSREFTDKTISMDEIEGNSIHELETQIFSAHSIAQRIQITENYLINRLKNSKTINIRFFQILDQIYLHNGQVPIEQYFKKDVEPRQLRRLFDRYVGMSPKKFARIIRIQSVLRSMLSANQSKSDLYLQYGYYDQSHFIHECKLFFGESPTSINFNS